MNACEAPDWLDGILKSEMPVPADPAFVAQVLQRLDMTRPVAPAYQTEFLLGWPWGETLMILTAITLLLVFTPDKTMTGQRFMHPAWHVAHNSQYTT